MIAAKHRTIGHIDFRSAIGFHLHTDNVAGVDNRDTEVDKIYPCLTFLHLYWNRRPLPEQRPSLFTWLERIR